MIDFRVKRLFFDRIAVMNAVDRNRHKVLSKQGALIAITAKHSMRYATKRGAGAKPSPPGQPPRAIKPHPFIRKFLYYSYDPASKSVVVGPIRLGKSTDAPAILEYGGTARKRKNSRRRRRSLGQPGEIRLGPGPSAKPITDWKGRRILVTYAILETSAQVKRSNELNELLFGPEILPAVRIAPRPFMRPALQRKKNELPKFWADSIR